MLQLEMLTTDTYGAAGTAGRTKMAGIGRRRSGRPRGRRGRRRRFLTPLLDSVHGEEEHGEAELLAVLAGLGNSSSDGETAAELRLGHGHGEEQRGEETSGEKSGMGSR